MNKVKNRVLDGFKSIYHLDDNIDVFFAPGRVNIIGEHIDYNGGHVLPCALSVGTYLACRKRDDKKVRLFSYNCAKAGVFTIDIDDIVYNKQNGWVNYPLGVFATLKKHNFDFTCGYDLYYLGNISGSGLSSSASIEVVTAYMLKEMNNFPLSHTEIAKLCQESENNFNGLNCGIMDQFASSLGRHNCAMYLDTKELNNKYIKMNLEPYQIVIINSQVPHSLTTSHYNDRLQECREALKILQTKKDINNLCDLSVNEFKEIGDVITNPILYKRAKFAIEEEDRVQKAISALNDNNIIEFGKLLTESGIGLKDDYEATCPQVDTLVDLCLSFDGCIGSRETGGGWGGNIIALVLEDKIPDFRSYVLSKYKEKTGLKASSLLLYIGNGVHKVK